MVEDLDLQTKKQYLTSLKVIMMQMACIAIRDAVAPNLPMSTFYNTLHRMEITFKKEPKYKERKESVRKEFIEQVSTLDLEDIIYIDESGTDNNIVPQYGWSKKA